MEYFNNVNYEEFDTILSTFNFENETQIGKNADNSKRNKMNEDNFQQLKNSFELN